MIPIIPKERMNKTELEFAWILEQKKRNGELIDYIFEMLIFQLADRTTYTPDFVITFPDHFEIVDIKARGIKKDVKSKISGKIYKRQWSSKRDDAAVKIKCCARLFPYVKWAYYFREEGGRWTREEIN